MNSVSVPEFPENEAVGRKHSREVAEKSLETATKLRRSANKSLFNQRAVSGTLNA
jgi:hypothetical protein